MSSNPRPVLVWFRQDLRIEDNAALTAAVNSKRPVLLVYILDDTTAGMWAMGGASRWWLHHSLATLQESIASKGNNLVLRRGDTLRTLSDLVNQFEVEAAYFTRAYEPHEVRLEVDVNKVMSEHGVKCHRFGGRLLFEPEEIETQAGEPYKVFTPFWKACLAHPPPKRPLPAPEKIPSLKTRVPGERLKEWKLLPTKPNWADQFPNHWKPGEAGALSRLSSFISESLETYDTDRDRPDLPHTSRLSPHLHFGEISPRTCWHAVSDAIAINPEIAGPGKAFLRELGWREFSTSLLHNWPDLPENPFKPEFANFPWEYDEDSFKAWCKGRTGYPIVDAGMRQLWQTGWMHNRVRMIVASFLIKDLLVPWQKGEAWFWDTLVDADLANNAASWQWVTGCGADAAPYFRIFNPVTQGKKFDPSGAYVTKWVPELSNLDHKHIHSPWEAPPDALSEAGVKIGDTYPIPLVEHKAARVRALTAFQKLKQ